ncbi:MAG: ABC transporter ATP-binding protein [Burkholderiaceae bacterium]
MRAPLLETRALTLRAAGKPLVDGLGWSVNAGERWCVIGRNGAGKSLVLRALAGLGVPQRSGEVFWRGRPQSAWPADAAAALRALMPQQAHDRFALTVERALTLSEAAPAMPAAANAGFADAGALTRAQEGPGASLLRRRSELTAALDIVALGPRRIDQLSGGERQRVALAQCATQGAALMLLDEPVSFQDPAHQQAVGRWLAAAADPAGRAWIATAHDPSWIARVATHVLALFGDGRWQAGSVDDMLVESVLERTYGCPWRSVDGAWLAR